MTSVSCGCGQRGVWGDDGRRFGGGEELSLWQRLFSPDVNHFAIDFVFPEVDFVASGIEDGNNFALGAACGGDNLQERDWHDRLLQNLSQGLDGGEPYTQAGERSGAGDHDEGADVGFAEAVRLKRDAICGTSCAENMPPARGTTSISCTSRSAARARATVPFLPEVSVTRRIICG